MCGIMKVSVRRGSTVLCSLTSRSRSRNSVITPRSSFKVEYSRPTKHSYLQLFQITMAEIESVRNPFISWSSVVFYFPGTKHAKECSIKYPNTDLKVELKKKNSIAPRFSNPPLGVWKSPWNTLPSVWLFTNLFSALTGTFPPSGIKSTYSSTPYFSRTIWKEHHWINWKV